MVRIPEYSIEPITCRLRIDTAMPIDALMKTVYFDACFPWHHDKEEGYYVVPPEDLLYEETIAVDLPTEAEYQFARVSGIIGPSILSFSRILESDGYVSAHPRELISLAKAWSGLPREWDGVHILMPPLRVTDLSANRSFIPGQIELSDKLLDWPYIEMAVGEDPPVLHLYRYMIRRR